VDALHSAGYSTAVGGLGPRMRSLGARSADQLLLNWLTPALAAEAREEAAEVAEATGRPRSGVALYVRTAVDGDALPLLQEEARRYAAIPSYAANFARHGIMPIETTIADTGSGIGDRLDAYLESVDELVLRAITPRASLDDYLRFVRHPDVAARLRLH
jgi:alkanesulfonate monooxygenase SsuD/methylene tetrahydromethanopterin reductase-like flavin-dependent oxidoreductase (luciferase family)